ncbi:MAG: mercury(II) reductase [Chloroflexota bacterium]
MSERFDLFILGSGSTAFAAALKANELGARVAMIERRTLGGTCANRGCLPSKNLIEAARIVHEAANPRYPGLAPATIEVDFEALIRQKDDVVHDYRQKKYGSVASSVGIDTLEGDARFVDANTVEVGTERIEADRILIATGSRPTIPPIPGLDAVPYMTSDMLDADEDGRLTELPESLIILGGGYIAVELAQMFSRLGSEVTLVQRSAELLSDYEPEFGPLVSEVFRREGMQVHTGTRIESVEGNEREIRVSLDVAGETRTVTAQRLLVALGRRPNSDDLDLAAAGVKMDADGTVMVDTRLRTSQHHIWAAGDVIGSQHDSQMATPVGARQGRIAADNAMGGADIRFDGSVIPRGIFIDPPIGMVGRSEAEIRARRLPAVTATAPLQYTPRAGAIHKTEGFVKMIASTIDEKILGVHVIGESAPEIIHEAAMAMKFGATIPDFVDLIHVYPTMSEALKIGAQGFYKDVSKLSCCAE